MSDDLKRLERTLISGPPFQLIIIEISSEENLYQSISKITKLLVERKKSEILEIDDIPDVATLEDNLESIVNSGTRVIHIVGGINWFNSKRWDHLNIRRERIASKVRANLILYLNAEMIGQFGCNAVDFWTWRSGIYCITD